MSNQNITCYRTNETGFLLVVVQVHRDDKKDNNIVFLIDLWKAGLIGHEVHVGTLAEVKRNLDMPKVEFYPISKPDAAELLARGKIIAEHLGVAFDEDTSKWLDRFKVSELKPAGTIYRCFACDKGDLTDTEVEAITKAAKADLSANLIGSKDEQQYFYVCSSCKDNLHKTHS